MVQTLWIRLLFVMRDLNWEPMGQSMEKKDLSCWCLRIDFFRKPLHCSLVVILLLLQASVNIPSLSACIVETGTHNCAECVEELLLQYEIEMVSISILMNAK